MENKENLKEYMFKGIDLIQDIIKRMAFNSFMVNGWAITLVVVALLLKGTEYQFGLPLFLCWSFGSWMHTFYCRNGCIDSCMGGSQ